MHAALRGFILQPTYRIEAGRPVVHLYGRLEDGRPFLVRDSRQVPSFYVDAKDADRALSLGARPLTPEARVTLTGEPVCRVEVAVPGDAPPLRDRLLRNGIPCHEADVRFAMRYLIDRGVRGSLAIRGEGRVDPVLGVVFDDPEVSPAEWTPRLRVVSIDIETDPQARRLLSIALHGAGASEVLMVGPGAGEARGHANERELLAAFEQRVRELDPDVLTGWNVVDFDFSVLSRIAWRLGVRLALGRGPDALRIRSGGTARAMRQVVVPGRVVLDGIQLARGAFMRMEDYALDAVARSVLGEGKRIDSRRLSGRARAEEVLRLYQEDPVRFADYNRTDARLALEILERLKLVELAAERSLLTGMPLDRVSSSIAAFDFRYLTELGRRGVVAPSVGAAGGGEPQSGGHVMEPVAGLHLNVAVLDFRSLYPTVIRTFQIDPLNLVRDGGGEEALVAPNGAAFRRRRGILTELLDELMPRREEARRAGDGVKSHAIKILMNSFYGVLGTPACRFYDPRLANAITGFGQELLLWCRDRIESDGRRVLYGDTDSLFVAMGERETPAARGAAERLTAELNRDLADHIARRWGVESRLDLTLDRLYQRLFFPSMRRGGGGARKRYVGLLEDGRVLFTGMEAVRGDWTALARDVQRELYARLFADQPLHQWLRQVVADLRGGRLDDQLVYRKSLRKDPAAYTATTPPHVAAARKQERRTRGRVAYVITTAGAEPAEERVHPLDYEHYVQKQVRAVADPVLALLGLDFAQVVGDARQLTLGF